jgi:hypothetical protein
MSSSFAKIVKSVPVDTYPLVFAVTGACCMATYFGFHTLLNNNDVVYVTELFEKV